MIHNKYIKIVKVMKLYRDYFFKKCASVRAFYKRRR